MLDLNVQIVVKHYPTKQGCAKFENMILNETKSACNVDGAAAFTEKTILK